MILEGLISEFGGLSPPSPHPVHATGFVSCFVVSTMKHDWQSYHRHWR